MYSCDLSFKVWEYTYEDFSIFDFYQFSIVVLVTYLHTHTYWESPETEEGEGRPGEPTVDVRHREQLLQLLPRLPVARGQGGAH